MLRRSDPGAGRATSGSPIISNRELRRPRCGLRPDLRHNGVLRLAHHGGRLRRRPLRPDGDPGGARPGAGGVRASGSPRARSGDWSAARPLLIGLIAGLLSLPLGMLQALVLIRVINRRSFGWTMESPSTRVLLQAVALVPGGGLLRRALPRPWHSRTSPALALKEEE